MDLQKMKDDPALGSLDAVSQDLTPSPRPKRTERLRVMDGVDAEFTGGEYEQLLEMYDQSLRTLAEGEVVRGRVLRISTNEVIVDVDTSPKGSSTSMSSAGRMASSTSMSGTRSTCSWRRPRTRTATSSSPRRRPRR